AAWPPLPEFYANGLHQVTSPIWRPVHGFHIELLLKIIFIFFEPLPTFNHLALRGNPGSNAASRRAAVKIFIAFMCAQFLYKPGDPYLPLDLFPEKYEAGS